MKKNPKVIEPKSDNPDPHHHEKETHFLAKFIFIIILISIVAYVVYTTGFIEKIMSFF
jgi:hypothetical protein